MSVSCKSVWIVCLIAYRLYISFSIQLLIIIFEIQIQIQSVVEEEKLDEEEEISTFIASSSYLNCILYNL